MFAIWVSVLLCFWFQCFATESIEDHIANERMKLACHVQVAPLTTELFDKCLTTEGMTYNLPQVFAPCSELSGMDLSTYEGIFNFACKQQGYNRAKVVNCVVKNIATTALNINIIELSKKSMDIAKICGAIVAKSIADAALKKVKGVTDKVLGGLPKLG